MLTATNLEHLIDVIFDVVRAAVSCDVVSVLYRNAGNGLLKARDSSGRHYDASFMRRYAELTPAAALALANPLIKILPTRVGLPRKTAALHRMPFYREVMRPLGWRHAVAVCFWGDAPGPLPTFVVSVERREGRRDFSMKDEAGLERLHPFVDCAVNRLTAGGTARTMRDGIGMAMRDRARGFAILDGDCGLVQSNAVANALCAAWAENDTPAAGRPARGVWQLPPVVLTTCHELRAEWQTAVRNEPDTAGIRRQRSIGHPTVPGLTVCVTHVGPDSSDLAEPVFVLEFDRRVHGIAVDPPDHSAALLEGMTAAERSVALTVADGFSNQEIADRLGKTIHSVKFLLHRIYQKTGIPNRAALVAVLRSPKPNG